MGHHAGQVKNKVTSITEGVLLGRHAGRGVKKGKPRNKAGDSGYTGGRAPRNERGVILISKDELCRYLTLACDYWNINPCMIFRVDVIVLSVSSAEKPHQVIEVLSDDIQQIHGGGLEVNAVIGPDVGEGVQLSRMPSLDMDLIWDALLVSDA
ncbi:hypothetical protein Tco_1216279 [Tanacetum coccineum]